MNCGWLVGGSSMIGCVVDCWWCVVDSWLRSCVVWWLVSCECVCVMIMAIWLWC